MLIITRVRVSPPAGVIGPVLSRMTPVTRVWRVTPVVRWEPGRGRAMSVMRGSYHRYLSKISSGSTEENVTWHRQDTKTILLKHVRSKYCTLFIIVQWQYLLCHCRPEEDTLDMEKLPKTVNVKTFHTKLCKRRKEEWDWRVSLICMKQTVWLMERMVWSI